MGCVISTFLSASMLQCVAVCCSVLQCVAGCCSVLRCVAVCCSVLQCVAVCCSVLQCVVVCCSVLQCVAVCFSVLQCGAVCCSVLQCGAVCCNVLQCVVVCASCHASMCKLMVWQHLNQKAFLVWLFCQRTLVSWGTKIGLFCKRSFCKRSLYFYGPFEKEPYFWAHSFFCCTQLQQKRVPALQFCGGCTATYCNILQHTATHCNILQHTE